jgi:putative hydrolase of the HAD superfamily
MRGVLFDFDGTLADTAGAERASWAALAELIRSHLPGVDEAALQERYQLVFEAHWSDYLEGRIDFPTYRRRRLTSAVEPWGAVDDELFAAYREEKLGSVERLRLFDDAVTVIRSLRARGLRVGLLTNGPSNLQRRKLEVTAIEVELDAVAISEEIGVAKPDVRAFEKAAEMIACRIADVAMVGDSPLYDIEGGIAAGVSQAVLIAKGPRPEIAGAAVVETLSDVPTALGICLR